MKRRSFIQTALAISGAFFLPVSSIFRKIKPAPVVKTGQAEAISIPASPDACRYIYNPGLDLEGVQDLTFHQYSVIPGGKVTRIFSTEEWTNRVDTHAAMSNPIRRERVVDPTRMVFSRWNDKTGEIETLSPPEIGYDERAIIGHSAQEVMNNLLDSLRPQHTTQILVEIKEWRGREIDVDRLNAMIYSSSFDGRMEALKTRSWINRSRLSAMDLTILSGVALPALQQFGADAKKLLRFRLEDSNWKAFDQFQLRLARLLFPDATRVEDATARLLNREPQFKDLRQQVLAQYAGYHETDQATVDAFRGRVRANLATKRLLDVS